MKKTAVQTSVTEDEQNIGKMKPTEYLKEKLPEYLVVKDSFLKTVVLWRRHKGAKFPRRYDNIKKVGHHYTPRVLDLEQIINKLFHMPDFFASNSYTEAYKRFVSAVNKYAQKSIFFYKLYTSDMSPADVEQLRKESIYYYLVADDCLGLFIVEDFCPPVYEKRDSTCCNIIKYIRPRITTKLMSFSLKGAHILYSDPDYDDSFLERAYASLKKADFKYVY